MSKKTIYHGSPQILEHPIFGKGKKYNDYGQGFYCTEHIEPAKEWACNEGVDGFANKYELDLTDLEILNLSEERCTILHWLALLMENHLFRVTAPVMRRGVQWLKEHFLIDIGEYDLIIGYRADDSYFSFARAFIFFSAENLVQRSRAGLFKYKSGILNIRESNIGGRKLNEASIGEIVKRSI